MDEEESDSCEDLGFTKEPSSDIDDDIPAVDTDDASLDSSGKTTASYIESSTGSDREAEPATGGSKPSPDTKGKATMQPATGGSKPSPATGGTGG